MKYRYWIVAVIFSFSILSCNNYLDINDDPNVATEAPLDGLVHRITYQTPHNVYRIAASYTNYYVQYFASPNQASPIDTYDEVDFSNRWADLYDVMTDAYDLIRFAQDIGANNHIAIGKLMMAVNLAMATDSWGSVPYSAGFSGDLIQLPYDPAEQVYKAIQNLVDDAIERINTGMDSSVPSADKDLIYAGNMQQWLKLAYGLKSRYLNRFSGTSKEDLAGVLEALEDGLTGNEDDAELTHFDVRNPWAQVAINNDLLLLDGWISEQFVDAMNGTTFGVIDPRLPIITEPFEENGKLVFRGTPNGAGRRGDGTIQEEVYLETSGFYSSEDAPLFLFTFAEQKFIEAEASFRIGDVARARSAFELAIRANMEKLGVHDTDVENYLEEKYPDRDSVTLEVIMEEKYLAMFLHPETWNDARRFDYQYTDFELPVNAIIPNYIRRIAYPDSEKSRNGNNVPSIGGLSDRVYWDE
ncbi:MAG TPA: SusD/RagB family nutrient-binding outer membrane lipoprotein [Membranihabitans sp.]|nr:SusD/RagB family nutrient-binding outer membrane lipoprotein [Membranihabitans sp.]